MTNTALQDRPKSVTVTTRIPAHLKERWQQAAAIRGVTLTDFMITAANNEADNIFEAEEKIRLSAHDQIELSKMLLRPARENEGMKTAIKAWKKHESERKAKGL
jgi:uncharacterized protein (DUF1778 family)